MAKILQLRRDAETLRRQRVGAVHRDGSITFRGHRYRTLGDVPPDCRGLRLDVPSHCQWRAIWRQIDPERKRRRRMEDASRQHGQPDLLTESLGERP